MRGYQVLQNTDRLSLIDDIKNTITSKALLPNSRSLAILKNEIPIEDHNNVVQQFLIERLLTLSFNRAILYAVGTKKKLAYALPDSWQSSLLEHGIHSNKILCRILFWKFILMQSIYGVAEFLFQILRLFRISIHNVYENLGSYVYFETLQSANLPDKSGYYQSGIISTYVERFPKPEKIDFICHRVKSKSGLVVNGIPTSFIPSPIPPVKGVIKSINFIISGTACLFTALFDALSGRWDTPLMAREKIRALTFSLSNSEKIAKQYLFHNSGWIYRPLWTYVAEKAGSRILFYFYSTNAEKFKKDGQYPNPMTNAWPITSWPEYLVWDIYQADFIKRVIHRKNKVTIVGAVSFVYSNKTLDDPNKKYIAVFDVQPLRDLFFILAGANIRYYVPEVAVNFLEDIISVSAGLNLQVVVKRKREIGKYLHSSYKSYIKRQAKLQNCIFVDPMTPPEEIIKQSELVISMPYTSTAILAKQMGKNSIYYDPLGVIEKDDRAAHGITVVSGREELLKWIELLRYEYESV